MFTCDVGVVSSRALGNETNWHSHATPKGGSARLPRRPNEKLSNFGMDAEVCCSAESDRLQKQGCFCRPIGWFGPPSAAHAPLPDSHRAGGYAKTPQPSIAWPVW